MIAVSFAWEFPGRLLLRRRRRRAPSGSRRLQSLPRFTVWPQM